VQLNELDEWRALAYENSRIYKDKVKQYHDKKIKQDKKFEKGDQVLLYNTRLRLFLGKLKSRWLGPYSVTSVSSQGVVEIYHPEKGQFKVNGNRLKPYFGKTPLPPDASGNIFPFEPN